MPMEKKYLFLDNETVLGQSGPISKDSTKDTLRINSFHTKCSWKVKVVSKKRDCCYMYFKIYFLLDWVFFMGGFQKKGKG